MEIKKLPQIIGRTIGNSVQTPLADAMRNMTAIIVLAGIADSKFYVKCEWLLDKFVQTFPKIPVKKIPLSEADWPAYAKNLTKPRGWPNDQQLVVFREALGSPFLYIGGLDNLRMYLKQLYNFTCALISEDLVKDYMRDNHLELTRVKEIREKISEPEDTWKVAIISHNHLEIVPLNLLNFFGIQNVLGGGKRVDVVICNSSAKHTQRLLYNWTEEPINFYLQENAWRFNFLKSAEYCGDLESCTKNKDLIIILWAMRQEVYDALEGRVYTFREGMDKELSVILCGEIVQDFGEILTSVQKNDNLASTKFLLASTRFKTPLSAVATYFLQKISKIPPSNLFVNPCIIERNYRSIIAEEIGIRTTDVSQIALWGDIGGTVMMDPTAVKIKGHNGTFDMPTGVDYVRPLLEIFWEARKLQVEFAVDTFRRAHYLELLEGPRCNSVLVAESTINLLRQWYGNTDQAAKVADSSEWSCVGIVTVPEMGTCVASGLVIAMPIKFSSDGTFQFVSQNSRDEVRAACKKATTELCEFLIVMKGSRDPDLPDPPPMNPNFPAINVIPESESQNQEGDVGSRIVSEVASMSLMTTDSSREPGQAT